MAPITTARLATCVVAATLVSAAAATLPTEARADDGPASVPSVAGDGAVRRRRRGARGGGERRGRGRDRRRARRGGAGDGAGGACGRRRRPPHRALRRPPRPCLRSRRHLIQAPAEPDTTPVSSDTAGWYRRDGAVRRPPAPAAAARAGLADQRQRQRPDREPGRQRAGHAGECRSGRRVGRARHRYRREPRACDTAAAPSTTSGAQASTPASQPAAGSSSSRAGRSGDVDVAVELPVDARSHRDTAAWFHDRICSEELDMDLELRRESDSVSETQHLRSISRRT